VFRNRPGVAHRVPRSLGFQIFGTFGTWRWWGHQPHAPAAFTPLKCSWYSFSLGAESTPGPWYGRKEMSLKNPVTPPGIDPGTVRLVAPGPQGWDKTLNKARLTTSHSSLVHRAQLFPTLSRRYVTVLRCHNSQSRQIYLRAKKTTPALNEEDYCCRHRTLLSKSFIYQQMHNRVALKEY
jgi:hypothetical protein